MLLICISRQSTVVQLLALARSALPILHQGFLYWSIVLLVGVKHLPD